MHQSFDGYAEQDAQRTRILFQEDSHIGDRDTRRFAYKVPADQRAADMMVEMMREGKVILVGDTLKDFPDSYKVSHYLQYPIDAAFCVGGDDETIRREVVEETNVTPAKPVFDFDGYNSLAQLPRIK